ncbi:MAG: cupredoxin domain-containing protein [Candidatus Woesearchaeota archaeon]
MKRGIIFLMLALLVACAAQPAEKKEIVPVVMEEIKIVEEDTAMPSKPLYEPPPTGPEGADVEAKLEAQANECLPSKLIARMGNKVRLIITAQDEDHKFTMPSFDIAEQLPKGEDVFIEFTANKQGEFTYECTIKDHAAKTKGLFTVI